MKTLEGKKEKRKKKYLIRNIVPALKARLGKRRTNHNHKHVQNEMHS